MDPAEIGNLLNTISLILMTALLSAGTFLNYVRAKRKKEKSTALIYLGTGWLGWALSYILISIRLGISIGDGDFHILMYKIILTLDAFGFGCFFFFIGRFFNEKQTGLYSKKSFEILGVFLFIIQTLFVWLVGGFGVEDTPFGVEILPSFVCQNIMAMAMIVGGVLFILSAKKFQKKGNSTIAKI